MFSVQIESYDDWRLHARQFLQYGIAPADIHWQSTTQNTLPFYADAQDLTKLPIRYKKPHISKNFLRLAKKVACYRDEDRWSLLYSLSWRLIFENSNLLNIITDTHVQRFLKMHKAIARAKHKMEAFLRFRRIENQKKEESSFQEYYIAWFEPEHFILPLTAPFFAKRFANMPWSILTPDACAHWDLHEITFTAGISKAPDINDDLEILWLEYYKNIFNPARLKLKAMQSEMPKKYWQNLPEAAIIEELIQSAPNQVNAMIDEGYTMDISKSAKSKYLKKQQSALRNAKK